MRFISFRTKIIVMFLLLVSLPTFGILYYIYSEFSEMMRNQIELDASNQLEQVNINIDRQLQTALSAMNSISLDNDIINLLQTPQNSERDKLDATKLMDKKFYVVTTTILDDSSKISLYDMNNNLYTNGTHTVYQSYSAELMDKIVQKNGFMVWSIQNSLSDESKMDYITVGKLVKDSDFKNLGIALISIPADKILDILGTGDSSSRKFGFLISEDGSVLGNNPEEMTTTYLQLKPQLSTGNKTFEANLEGNMYLVSTYALSLPGWHVVQVIPFTEMYHKVSQMGGITVLILIVTMTIFIALIIFFSSMLTKPLRELRQVMKQVEVGNLNVSCEVKSKDEIGLLSKSMNNMLVRLKYHIENELILQRQKEHAKLKALQSQITPHFLYNTMNTIRWMSVMSGTKNITKMLISLGHLLNMSIHRGQENIKFSEELENVRHFLMIQKYRFGETIVVKEDISPSSLDCFVPKLSLQPLVENVYQHGKFDHSQGQLVIRTKFVQNKLFVEVADSGIGFTKERMDEIRKSLNQPFSDSSSGIGLKNVHDRVQLMYGSGYGINLAYEDHMNVVSIKLPTIRGELENEDRNN